MKGEGIREKLDGRRMTWEGYNEEEVWNIVHYLWHGRWRHCRKSVEGEREVV